MTAQSNISIIGTASGNGKFNSNAQGGGGGVVASYRFDISDTMQTVKGSFSWDGLPVTTINTASGETEKGVLFGYGGDPDPTTDQMIEKRFTFGAMSELSVHHRFHVPANYLHRQNLEITVSGDISAWAIGDTVVGTDATSSGVISYKNGTSVYLLFADNNIYGGVWTGTVTNTTRGESRSSTRVGNLAANNKLFALWCDGYSNTGGSPTIAWEMSTDELGGSRLYYHFGADYNVLGTLPNSTSSDADFIRVSDVNKWFDVVYYIKMATSEAAEDGIVRTYLKREGESSYALLHQQTNAKIGARAAASFAQFSHGYCHGWSNSGFTEATEFRDSVFELAISPASVGV